MWQRNYSGYCITPHSYYCHYSTFILLHIHTTVATLPDLSEGGAEHSLTTSQEIEVRHVSETCLEQHKGQSCDVDMHDAPSAVIHDISIEDCINSPEISVGSGEIIVEHQEQNLHKAEEVEQEMEGTVVFRGLITENNRWCYFRSEWVWVLFLCAWMRSILIYW